MACCIICDRPDISIHALLAESDVAGLIFRAKFVIFLSTLSLRRATSAPAIKSCWSSYFYPRSPCGERLRVSVGDAHVCVISIHALLAESDQLLLDRGLTRDDISIHALLAESDTTFSGTVHRKEISIHALLAESDSGCPHRCQQTPDFYPRSPCGERPPQGCFTLWEVLFLSTLSLRRATPSNTRRLTNKIISIHALLAESDVTRVASTPTTVISIHALLAESDGVFLA